MWAAYKKNAIFIVPRRLRIIAIARMHGDASCIPVFNELLHINFIVYN